MEKKVIDRVLELAVEIQQIPAPPFQEDKRAELVRSYFLKEGLADISTDTVGNVYARLPGSQNASPLVVTAHLDTVFPTDTKLQPEFGKQKITAPGIGDNSLGVAGLFGLLWSLRERGCSLPGDLWLVANVGEEGLGNLRGMHAVVNRFGREPLAYLVLEGMALGQVYHRGLGVKRYRISVHTPGGHSWVDYGRPSAIHILAGLVTRLAAMPLPVDPRTTLNVGVIEGGISVNTIAAHAHLELDLRSEDPRILDHLATRVEEIVKATARPNVRVKVELIGDRPAGELPPNHPLVHLAVRALEAQGLQPRFNAGSTDANVPLSLGLPGVCLGLTTGSGAHTLDEYINTEPLVHGLDQVVWIAEHVHYELEGKKVKS